MDYDPSLSEPQKIKDMHSVAFVAAILAATFLFLSEETVARTKPNFCSAKNGLTVKQCQERITRCSSIGIIMKWNPVGCLATNSPNNFGRRQKKKKNKGHKTLVANVTSTGKDFYDISKPRK